MPSNQVMHEWKKGTLHSGSHTGPKVTSRKQAVAIMLSEKEDESTAHESRSGDKKEDKQEKRNRKAIEGLKKFKK